MLFRYAKYKNILIYLYKCDINLFCFFYDRRFSINIFFSTEINNIYILLHTHTLMAHIVYINIYIYYTGH